ncbi:MAG: winged helix-turn-helix domain-containing protein [Armatimonadota bacterium]|nr:winged helix-turn-helix domain-containing protein [Armatimonadota bacterium]
MPNIRIDREVYTFLKGHAEPFVDTPNSVLRRLLGLDAPNTTKQDNKPGGPETRLNVGEEFADGVRARKSDGEKKRKRGSAKPMRGRKPQRMPRVPPGSLIPEGEYIAPLLTALAERGGSAPAREIIEAVGERLGNRLTPADVESLPSGHIRWQNRVQFVRLRLVEEGLLSKDTPRGVWGLTDAGWARAAELKK